MCCLVGLVSFHGDTIRTLVRISKSPLGWCCRQECMDVILITSSCALAGMDVNIPVVLKL